MNNHYFYLIIVSVLIFQIKVHSQSNINFNHLDVADGLSQSAVTCIMQDSKGFMWFGTQDGLNRYDGYEFKIFRSNSKDPASLTDNFIFSLILDSLGVLYAETQNGNLHKYNPLTETFTLIQKDSISFSGANINTVGAVFYEKPGVTWTGGLSRSTGLVYENKNNNQIRQYKNDPNNPSSLSSDRVYSIHRDRKGSLWIGTNKGLDEFDEEKEEFIHFKYKNQGLSNSWVWPIFEDSRGNLWIGTVGDGLYKIDPDKEIVTNYRNESSDIQSLSDNFIFSIFEDKSGIIWIGTNSGGINYFHPSTTLFNHYKHDPNNKNSLSANSVNSIFVDQQGNYWFGTLNGGLDKLLFETGKFTSITKSSNGLVSNSIQTIYEDDSGMFWFGSFSEGLNSYDPSTGKYKLYSSNPSDSNSLSDNRIYSILQDSEGFIWIGTYGGGLNRLDKKTGNIEHFQFDENDPYSISSNSAWSLIEDDMKNIWIGTYGGGINILDPLRNKFLRIQNDPDDTTSLPDNNIIRIFQDSKKNIWVGTTKGLSKYLKETKNFKNYNEENGLPNDVIYGIVEDDNGYLWISTNKGLAKFDPETEIFKNYFALDGLQGNEFNQNAFAKDEKTGRILFGGPNGINIFHPDSIKTNKYVPPVVLTDYLRYNTDDEEGRPIDEKGITEIDSVFLTYKDNIIIFKFSALNFFNTEKNQYRYKLEGFDENWFQLDNNRTVTFTNLSSGEYNFRVIGSNNDGVWNEKGAGLYLNVSPPWWKTNVAYAIYILIIGGILLTIRRFEKNRQDQKAQIRENELLLIAGESEKRALKAENERKTKELEEARAMQLAMLPKEIPELDHLEIAVFMRTATEVGGDYYDFILDKGVLNIAFGDATGHGLQAGTMVTLMKGFFTSYAANSDIESFLNRCTKTIKEIKLGRIMMAFSFLKILDHKLHYSSVAMPPMYYIKKDSLEVEEIVVKGMPLGAMSKVPFYKEVEKELKTGDIFILFSDGIPEQVNNNEEMYDYARFKEKVKDLIYLKPQEIIEAVINEIDSWRGDKSQNDDISMMVVKVI